MPRLFVAWMRRGLAPWRDRYIMEVLDRQYPQYQFARHKGYGTKLHYACLNEYGPCPAHRKTFLKKWEARR